MNQSINPALVGMFMYIGVLYALIFDIFVFDAEFEALQMIGGGLALLVALIAAIEKKMSADKK